MAIKFSLYLLILCAACHVSQPRSETRWRQLFNGKDLSDWKVKIKGHALNDNYANTFRVENNLLKVSYDGYEKFDSRYGHLFNKNKFSNYLLAVEYRFVGEQVQGGPGWALRNSGVMLHCQQPETMMTNQDFPISIEAQFLGGNGKDERTTANLCTPGTNVVLNGQLFTPHCTPSRSKTFHGDQWVRMEALVLADSLIEHFINGESVLMYEKPQIGGGNVSDYDPAVKKDGQLLKEGFIALQSESHPIEFRKVEIFDLNSYVGDKAKLTQILQQLTVR